MISARITVTPQFYDIDAMQVVWHGNYVRFFEEARCALLEKIGYGYEAMAASGYSWPVVDLKVRYSKPVKLFQAVEVEAVLRDYENYLRINYRCRDAKTGATLTKGQTTQVAISLESGETCLESPPVLVDKVRRLL
jgi:acyl-CoA thioester hydrolase